jgi:hypothetical protein
MLHDLAVFLAVVEIEGYTELAGSGASQDFLDQCGRVLLSLPLTPNLGGLNREDVPERTTGNRDCPPTLVDLPQGPGYLISRKSDFLVPVTGAVFEDESKDFVGKGVARRKRFGFLGKHGCRFVRKSTSKNDESWIKRGCALLENDQVRPRA